MGLPIRARLTLVTGGLLAAVLAALGTFVYVRLDADLADAVDAGLRSRAEVLLNGAGGTGPGGSAGLSDADEAFVQVLSRDGTIIESSSGLSAPLLNGDEVATIEGIEFFERTVPTTEEPVPARLLAVPTDGDDVLVVGASLEDQNEALARLLALFALGGPAAIVFASAIGWVVAGVALRPVERMRIEAQALSGSEPGRRLQVPATNDELSRLADGLNSMLARLELGLERERRFVADASHELRTPLANLRAEIELALRRSRTNEELTDALRSAGEEAERLSLLAEDLLVLARAAEGGLPVQRHPTDVTTLVREEVERFVGRAANLDRTLTVHASETHQASVDPARLRQAVGNLIDNALRHAPSGGRVDVTVSRRQASIEIEIADDGDGLTKEFLARLAEPFSRQDASRTRSAGGAGLGLAIVRAVVDAHGGHLRAENGDEGGARITIAVPA